jgi:hypothetical protein
MRLQLYGLASLALASLIGCIDGPDELAFDEDTSELAIVNPPPSGGGPVLLASHNRMLWRDYYGGNGELWVVNDTGTVRSRTAFSIPDREALGVAGNRALWRNGTAGAEMRSFDDNGVIGTTVYTIPNPNPARYTPRSIALATASCWSPAAQNYYILWDDVDRNEVAIQLVDQTGVERRFDVARKPSANMPAMWFGIAADGFEQLMLRSGSTGNLFRATWNTVPTGWVISPTLKAAKSRPTHVPANTGRLVSSSTFWGGTWDQMLFVELSSGTPTNNAVVEVYQPTANMPPLLNHIIAGNPPVISRYTGATGQFAWAYSANPKLCP